ncbi:hypothetical protein [Butyricicoccus sp.]|uniref:hypothetical protein n=1 Tax=Butyricicoccus sp. TaxID=2049021 RepID=UPI003F17F3C2
MLDLILKILSVVIAGFTSTSVIRMYVRRKKQHMQSNIFIVGKPAGFSAGALSCAVLCFGWAIYNFYLNRYPYLLCDNAEIAEISVILALFCLLYVAFRANCEVVCDEKSITEYTFFWHKNCMEYQSITCISPNGRKIWYDNGTKRLDLSDSRKERRATFSYINEKYREIFGDNIPRKELAKDRWAEHIPVQLFIIMLLMSGIFFSMWAHTYTKPLNMDNTGHCKITFTEYTIEERNNNTIIYLYSPELDYPIRIESGLEPPEKRNIPQILAECDGKTEFDMYGSFSRRIQHIQYRYNVYYLADKNGTVYINRFEKINLRRQKYKPLLILFSGIVTILAAAAITLAAKIIWFANCPQYIRFRRQK